MIEIPEEFQNIKIEDDYTPRRKARTQRKRIYTRSDRYLQNYDAWRVFDRKLGAPEPKSKAVCKIEVAPALLKRAFGSPDDSEYGFSTTGMYDFEDSFLDLYRLIDYKQTDYYHGLPREPEFYDTPRNLRKQAHKRARPYPSYDEFWALEEPIPFRLMASYQADWRRFRRWFRKHLMEIEGKPEYDYDTIALEKFESENDVCLGDYEEKGVVNHDIAAFRWSNLHFMSKAEIKKLPAEDKYNVPEMPKYPEHLITYK